MIDDDEGDSVMLFLLCLIVNAAHLNTKAGREQSVSSSEVFVREQNCSILQRMNNK